MPDLGNLKDFEDFLFRLSDEPDWRAQKGEFVDHLNSSKDSGLDMGSATNLQKNESLNEDFVGNATNSQENESLNEDFVGSATNSQEDESLNEDFVGSATNSQENESLNEEFVDSANNSQENESLNEDFVGSANNSQEDESLNEDFVDSSITNFDKKNLDISLDKETSLEREEDIDLDLINLPDIDDLGLLSDLPDLDDIPSINEETQSQKNDKEVGDSADLKDFLEFEEDIQKTENGSLIFDEEEDYLETNSKFTNKEKIGKEEEELIYFENSEVEAVEKTLEGYPRNLRIAVEEVLSSPDTADQTIKMIVDRMVRGVSLRSIADDVRKITGRTVIIPLSYDKKLRDREKKKTTFFYLFRTKAWPILCKICVLTLLICVLILCSFHFIYRPIVASYYYSKGYKNIASNQYKKSELFFEKALSGWNLGYLKVKGVVRQDWFYKYADFYIEKRQVKRAIMKYEQLLEYYPNSKKAYLEYANFEREFNANYEAADHVFTRYLTNIDPYDADILLSKGDNLFEWGAIFEKKTEEARRVYADLLNKTGRVTTEIGMRFLRYAIRVDNRKEIERWSNYFATRFERGMKFKLDPVAFSELAGWYLDDNNTGSAIKVLNMAINDYDNHIDVLYQMVRYYQNDIGDAQEENFLQRLHYELISKGQLNWKEKKILIDTYRRFGLLYGSRQEKEKAENYFSKSLSVYETAVKSKILLPREEFGKIYKEFADLYYIRDKDYSSALIYMNRALDNLYDTPELRYKLGYSYSVQKKYDNALEHFYYSFQSEQDNKNVLFSYATTLAKVGNYAVAEGVYQKLSLELERDQQIPDEDVSVISDRKKKLIDLLCKTYNNLGVVRYHLSKSTPDSEHYFLLSELNFGKSVLYWDQLTQNSQIKENTAGLSLPQMNFQAVSNPSDLELELQIFEDLSYDFLS